MDSDKVIKISGNNFIDDRGKVKFVNDFSFQDVKRFYQVENHNKNYIRAWHGHEREGKYIFVSSGTALIGVVNLVTQEVQKFVLNSELPTILYVPPGYANGFKNLEDRTIIQFFSTSTLEESKGDDIRFPWDKWNIWNEEYR